VTRQAITKHLEVLAAAGLVSGMRRGRERVWRFEPKRLEDAHAFLDRISRQWDSALARLAKLVEE
jgi:DNA-binding transcriptional ArsR family regulator